MTQLIELPTTLAEKCVANGIFQATNSDGPGGTQPGAAFQRIRQAPNNDLVTSIGPTDFADILGLRLETFVAGDCSVLDEAKQAEIWTGILDTAQRYWQSVPTLPNPFPRQKFDLPGMDCNTTTVNTLTGTLINSWRGAQA
jgi:hypothetical protein